MNQRPGFSLLHVPDLNQRCSLNDTKLLMCPARQKKIISSHTGFLTRVWIHQHSRCKSPGDEPAPFNVTGGQHCPPLPRVLAAGCRRPGSQISSADFQVGCWADGCTGRKENQADLTACLAGWFLVIRGFLTPCESFSLTDQFQGKRVSQPDLHTCILSALPCNWKADLEHRSGGKHCQKYKVNIPPKMGGGKFTL